MRTTYTSPMTSPTTSPETRLLTVHPIGVVRSPFVQRAEAPHQATVLAKGRSSPAEGSVLLYDTLPLSALRALEGFERLWLITWLHRSDGWRATVHAPRGPRVRRGVLATRAPHRPNPLGLSCVRLLGVEGRVLRIAELDLLDGTPVLDIKPYIPYADAFANARAGWVDEVDAYERACAAQATARKQAAPATTAPAKATRAAGGENRGPR